MFNRISFTINVLILLYCFGASCRAQTVKAINVNQYGVTAVNRDGESDTEKFKRWQRINTLFIQAIKNKTNLYFPKGMYDVGDRNFPFRTPENVLTDDLLDCSNISIYGEEGTVFKTSSKNGADVLQLNKVKNVTFKNIDITASVENKNSSGSNGISITNGFDNIFLENINIYDLPGKDKGYWIDGGKAITIQNAAGSKAYKGAVYVKNIIVKNCAYGLRIDTNHISDLMTFYKSFKLSADISVDKAFQGVSIEFGEATKKSPQNAMFDINIKANLSNCQQYVNFVRVIGGTYNFILKKTQSYQQILRDQHGQIWSSRDGRVLGFYSGYTKNTDVKISGNVGEVDNKIRIGVVGIINEPFGLKNSTENNFFNFDIQGVSVAEDINVTSYNGESLNNNVFQISTKTIKKVPQELKLHNNQIKLF